MSFSGGHKEPEDVATPRGRRSQSDTLPNLDSLKVPEDGHGLGLRVWLVVATFLCQRTPQALPCREHNSLALPLDRPSIYVAARKAGQYEHCSGLDIG